MGQEVGAARGVGAAAEVGAARGGRPAGGGGRPAGGGGRPAHGGGRPGGDGVRPAGGGVRSGDGNELATLLQALADPARLRVVDVLSRSPRRAGDLAEEVGVPAPTMSKHLRVLLAAGIVADERGAQDARVRVFRLRRESVVAVRAWLDQVQAHWDEQLMAFKAHVEGRSGDG